MGLREWWDKLMGKKDEAVGERGYRAGSEGAGSASATDSDPMTDRGASVGSASNSDPVTGRDASSDPATDSKSTDPAGDGGGGGGDGSAN